MTRKGEKIPCACIIVDARGFSGKELAGAEKVAFNFLESLTLHSEKKRKKPSKDFVFSVQSSRDIWYALVNATLKGNLLKSPNYSAALTHNAPGFHFVRDIFPYFIEIDDRKKVNDYLAFLRSLAENFVAPDEVEKLKRSFLTNRSVITRGVIKRHKGYLLHLVSCLEILRRAVYEAGDEKQVTSCEVLYNITETFYTIETSLFREFSQDVASVKEIVPVTLHIFDRFDDKVVERYKRIFSHVYLFSFPKHLVVLERVPIGLLKEKFYEEHPTFWKEIRDIDCMDVLDSIFSPFGLLDWLPEYDRDEFLRFSLEVMDPVLSKLRNIGEVNVGKEHNLFSYLEKLVKVAGKEVSEKILTDVIIQEDDNQKLGREELEDEEIEIFSVFSDDEISEDELFGEGLSDSSSPEDLLSNLKTNILTKYDFNKNTVHEVLFGIQSASFFRRAVEEMLGIGWEEEKIISRLTSFAAGIIELLSISESSSRSGKKPITNVFKCPPDVILGYEVVDTPYKRIEENWEKISEIIDDELPVIGRFAKLIIKGYLVPMLKGKQVQVPLFVGPPSTGKTFVPQVIADVLSAVGIRTICLIENAASTGYNKDTEIMHAILGSEPHWSNAFPGRIVKSLVDGYELVIVILDEIDKRTEHSVFLELFDVSQPLQDVFVKHAAPFMNLRKRTMFIATANEYNISDSAVKSRVSKILWKYTTKDKEEIFKKLLFKKVPEMSRVAERDREKILTVCLKMLERASIRELISVANQMVELVGEPELFKCALETIDSAEMSGDKKQIGF